MNRSPGHADFDFPEGTVCGHEEPSFAVEGDPFGALECAFDESLGILGMAEYYGRGIR